VYMNGIISLYESIAQVAKKKDPSSSPEVSA